VRRRSPHHAEGEVRQLGGINANVGSTEDLKMWCRVKRDCYIQPIKQWEVSAVVNLSRNPAFAVLAESAFAFVAEQVVLQLLGRRDGQDRSHHDGIRIACSLLPAQSVKKCGKKMAAVKQLGLQTELTGSVRHSSL